MACSLDVVLASIIFITNVRYFLINGASVIFSSLVIVINIVIFVILIFIILESLCNLEENILFVLIMFIVWVYEHVLVVICDVIVLVDMFFICSSLVNKNLFFLDNKLRILVLQEWVEYIHFQVLILLVIFKLLLLFFFQCLLLLWIIASSDSLIWRWFGIFPFSRIH